MLKICRSTVPQLANDFAVKRRYHAILRWEGNNNVPGLLWVCGLFCETGQDGFVIVCMCAHAYAQGSRFIYSIYVLAAG